MVAFAPVLLEAPFRCQNRTSLLLDFEWTVDFQILDKCSYQIVVPISTPDSLY